MGRNYSKRRGKGQQTMHKQISLINNTGNALDWSVIK